MHEDLDVKELIIKEDLGFRLKVKSWECVSPKGLFAYEFINEQLKDGEIIGTSTYNFFMSKEEIKKLSQSLLND